MAVKKLGTSDRKYPIVFRPVKADWTNPIGILSEYEEIVRSESSGRFTILSDRKTVGRSAGGGREDKMTLTSISLVFLISDTQIHTFF